MILRCLYHSLDTVGLAYFLTIGLILSVSTSIAYLLAVIFAIPRFVLVLLSTEFLIYRLKGINSRICQRFINAEAVDGGKKIRQQRASLFRALKHLNDFCQQFQAINSVLDASISMLLAGVMIFLFAVPYFVVFAENEQSVRLVFCFLATVTYMFCFSFSICNDRLQKQVSAFVNDFTEIPEFIEPPSVQVEIQLFLSSLLRDLERSRSSRTPYTTFSHFSNLHRPNCRSTTFYR